MDDGSSPLWAVMVFLLFIIINGIMIMMILCVPQAKTEYLMGEIRWEELTVRGITATVAAGKSSYIGTCLASPVAWIFASVLLWVMYFYVMKDMARKLYGTNKL